MAEIKKYLDSSALSTLVTKIKSEDDAHLAEAKQYADGLAKNYDASGAAATAESNAKAYTDQLASGQVATNKADIAKLNGDASTEGSVAKAVADSAATLQESINGVDAKAIKNAEDIAAINNAESGILKQSKDYTDDEVAKVQGEVDALEELVGVLPEGTTAKDVVDYINIKTAGIATDAALGELQSQLSGVQGEVATIKSDYLKGADKTELEGKINVKADQTALDEVAGVANAAATKVALEEEVNRAKGEESRIEGLVTAEVAKAREEEGKLDARLVEVETFFKTAEGETLDQALDTLVEIQKYVTDEGAAADQMVKDIAANKKAIEDHIATDHDFASADAALKTELEGKINAKADSSVVTELSGKVSTNEQAITALQGADTTLSGRIDALEGQLGESGSVADDIATAKQEAIDAAAADATTKANTAESNAKGYTDAEIDKVEGTIATLTETVNGKAAQSEVNTISGKVGTLETDMAQAKTDIDAVELKAANNETAIGTINTELAKKAAQTDLDNAVARIAANETAIATKASDADLDDAVERIAANEAAISNHAGLIAANTSAINSFTPITSDEVTALFA